MNRRNELVQDRVNEQQKRDAQVLGYLVVPQKPRLKGDDYPDVVEYAVAVTQALNSCSANIRSARKIIERADSGAERDSNDAGRRGGRGGRGKSERNGGDRGHGPSKR